MRGDGAGRLASRPDVVGRTEITEVGVQRVEPAHHRREGRMHVAGLDARDIGGGEASEARSRTVRQAAARGDTRLGSRGLARGFRRFLEFHVVDLMVSGRIPISGRVIISHVQGEEDLRFTVTTRSGLSAASPDTHAAREVAVRLSAPAYGRSERSGTSCARSEGFEEPFP